MYNKLSASDLRALRVERLAALEIEHYRHKLCLEETPGDKTILRKLEDFEERMAVHVAALNDETDDISEPPEER